MKRRPAKSLFKGSKAFRLLYLPPDAAYGDGGYFAPPPAAARPALTQGAPAADALGDAAAVKQSFLDKALAAYELSYKELVANWRGLDDKAQGTITVAGIFIAASFAFLQNIQPELVPVEKMVLGAALLLLVASVMFAVRVLMVKKVAVPAFEDKFARLAKSLHGVSEGPRFPQFVLWTYEAYFNYWRKVIDATQELTSKKARQLSQAQLLLQAAIVAAALLAVVRVIVVKTSAGAGG